MKKPKSLKLFTKELEDVLKNEVKKDFIRIDLTIDEAEQFLQEYKHIRSDKFTILQYINTFIKLELKERKGR